MSCSRANDGPRSAGVALGPPAVALVVCCLLVGCGGSAQNRVSGTVNFEGKPVPLGKIYFNPDKSKNTPGLPGYADIKDGSFDTAASGGQGAPSGAVIVHIEGFEPVAPTGDVSTKPLFFPYEVAADLPKHASTQNYDVPASATKQPAKTQPQFITP